MLGSFVVGILMLSIGMRTPFRRVCREAAKAVVLRVQMCAARIASRDTALTTIAKNRGRGVFRARAQCQKEGGGVTK